MRPNIVFPMLQTVSLAMFRNTIVSMTLSMDIEVLNNIEQNVFSSVFNEPLHFTLYERYHWKGIESMPSISHQSDHIIGQNTFTPLSTSYLSCYLLVYQPLPAVLFLSMINHSISLDE